MSSILVFCRTQDLPNLTLVNSIMREEAERLLYKTLALGNDTESDTLNVVVSLLASNPQKARLVRSLALAFERRLPDISLLQTLQIALEAMSRLNSLQVVVPDHTLEKRSSGNPEQLSALGVAMRYVSHSDFAFLQLRCIEAALHSLLISASHSVCLGTASGL
jgi:hypothetical protein